MKKGLRNTKYEIVNTKHGFTLIELLVVIFIIGILAAALFPNFMSARQRARDSTRKHDLLEIKNALRMYYNDHQAYPATLGTEIFGCNSGPGNPITVCDWNSIWQKDNITYMQRMPFDPIPTESYSYCVSGDLNGFVVWAELENLADLDADTSRDRCGISDGTDPCAVGPVCSGTCYYVCGN